MQLLSKQFQEIQKLLGDLKLESESNTTLILVEGRKDIEAIQKLGISKNIAQFQGRSLTYLCDFSTKFDKIIILTDFDDYGQKIAKSLQQNLRSRGLNANLHFYHKLKFYFKKVSKDIEGLPRVFQQIEFTNNKILK